MTATGAPEPLLPRENQTAVCKVIGGLESERMPTNGSVSPRKGGAWVADPLAFPLMCWTPPTVCEECGAVKDCVVLSASSGQALHRVCGPCPSTQHARTEPHRPSRAIELAEWDSMVLSPGPPGSSPNLHPLPRTDCRLRLVLRESIASQISVSLRRPCASTSSMFHRAHIGSYINFLVSNLTLRLIPA